MQIDSRSYFYEYLRCLMVNSASCCNKVTSRLVIHVDGLSVGDGHLVNCIKLKDLTDLVCLSESPI